MPGPSLINYSGCDNCTLRAEWPYLLNKQMPVITPRQQGEERIVFIGEAPGADEDREGIPFVGKSGQFLRNVIPEKWKKQIYWTNTVRCRPPKNRTPIIQEIECCDLYLKRDLDIIKPHAILAIGDVALKIFWDAGWVSGMRGIPFPYKLNCGLVTWVMASFHPSYVMRQERSDYSTGKTTNSMTPVFRNDIEYFFDQLPNFIANPPKIVDPPKNILYPKSKEEALSLFNKLKDPFAVDLETVKLKPYIRDSRIITAGFSDSELTFAFPVSWPGHFSTWGQDTFNTMMLSGRRWIAQNAGFEYIWTWDATKTFKHDFDDIEVLSRLVHKRKGLGGLDDLSRIYLGIDIKQLANVDRNNLLSYPMSKVLEYNAIDAWSERCIFDILMSKTTKTDRENYYRILSAIKSTVAMEINGLEVDKKEGERLEKELFFELQQHEQDARRIKEVIDYEKETHRIFQLSAPETVGHVLVKYCGLDLPKTPKETQYSTNEKDLAPLAGKHELVDIVLDYREVAKLLSTYITPILKGEILAADGMLHPSYTVIRTATYRLSSENPNIQNFPKRAHREIRRQLVAPKGHIFAAFDYGQLEGRVLCMYSKDPNLSKAMILQSQAIAAGDKAKIEEYDIHYKWLYRIIDLYPRYLDRLAKVSGEKEEKKIIKAGRTIIKTDFVFASFYGSQPPSISNRTGLPMDLTTQVLGEFWQEYSETKKWVDNQFVKYQATGQVQSITGRIRNENLAGNEVINCVDYETEALTQRGWITGNELETGDVLLTMNPKSHLLEWQAAVDIRKFPEYEGQLYELKSESFSAVTTPNHRWAIEENGSWQEKTSETLPASWGSIPRILPYSYSKRKKYTDDLIRLVGWVLTDGFYSGEGNRNDGYAGSQTGVCQCKEENIPIIDNLFERLKNEGINVRTKLLKNRKPKEEIFWYFSGNSGRWFRSMFPKRELTPEFILQLPIEQLKILFETMMYGDGSKKTENSNASFSCRTKEGIDAFQMLGYLAGETVHIKHESVESKKNYPSNQKKYSSMGNIPKTAGGWVACILTKKKHKISLGWVTRTIKNEKRGVWCPIVPNTFFVCRRKGKPYITGNTPVQGLAAELVIEAQNALFNLAMTTGNMYILPRVNIHDDLMFILLDDSSLEGNISTISQEIVKPRFDFINVPLMTELRVGYNWCDLESICNFVGTYV